MRHLAAEAAGGAGVALGGREQLVLGDRADLGLGPCSAPPNQPPPMPDVSDDMPQPPSAPSERGRDGASLAAQSYGATSRLRHDAPVRTLARSLADRYSLPHRARSRPLVHRPATRSLASGKPAAKLHGAANHRPNARPPTAAFMASPSPSPPVPGRAPPSTSCVAAPRGFCAGVDRAIKIVELALQKFGAPVYVRHEIVHNRHVVDVPQGQRRHFCGGAGRDPRNRRPCDLFGTWGAARRCRPPPRRATCSTSTPPARSSPRCTPRPRAHHEAGCEIVLIGHAGHPEVVGTLGQLPAGAATLVETAADAARFDAARPEQLAYITQTTLSVDDTAAIVAVLQAALSRPSSARTRRTSATPPPTGRRRSRRIAARCDALIVVGAPNSSNSLRLVEVAERAGCPQGAAGAAGAPTSPGTQFDGIATLGITAGASAPELLVERDHRRLPRPLRRHGRERGHHRGAHRLQRAARAARGAALPRSRRIPRRRAWRSTPKSPTTTWRGSSPATTSARCSPTRASPRASRTPTTSCTPSKGPFFLTLYEKRVAPGDLPFFLGLMEHLAKARPHLPDAGARRQGAHAAQAGRPAGRARHVPGGRVDQAAAGRATARPSARRMARLHLAGRRASRCSARQCAGARRLAAALSSASAPAPTRSRRACAPIIEQELDAPRGELAGRPAAGRHPRRPVPRQRVLPRRHAVGADRLLFRLQRCAGLRRRHRAQRLVLRDRPLLQRHQGPGAAQGLPERARARAPPSARRCRCWRAARRCASC